MIKYCKFNVYTFEITVNRLVVVSAPLDRGSDAVWLGFYKSRIIQLRNYKNEIFKFKCLTATLSWSFCPKTKLVHAVGVGGAWVLVTEALFTVVEKRLPDARDGRDASVLVPDASAASSLPSLAAAGAVGDAPPTLFSRDGTSNDGLGSATSVSRRNDCCAVGESSTGRSTARAKGFPSVAGLRILWCCGGVPEDIKEEDPEPIRDGRRSGFEEEPLQSDASIKLKWINLDNKE